MRWAFFWNEDPALGKVLRHVSRGGHHSGRGRRGVGGRRNDCRENASEGKEGR